jgi:DNA-binding MurR/RpiR family transcriptional regulator
MDPIPVRLPLDLHTRVDKLAAELSISRSAVLRLAIQQWLDASDLHGLNPLLRDALSKPKAKLVRQAPPAPAKKVTKLAKKAVSKAVSKARPKTRSKA